MRKVTEQDLENIIKDPKKAKVVEKGSNFSSVAYGLLGMAITKAEELSGGKPEISDLYNILEYFNNYGDLEILTWAYKSILSKYPEFEVTSDVLASKEDPDSALKIKAKTMVQSGAKQKGLVS
jgi:hypothetical protein